MKSLSAVSIMQLSSILTELFAHARGVGLRGLIQFTFAADEQLWVEAGDEVRVAAGRRDGCDTEIEISAENFLAVVAGGANVEQLFAAGALRIRGNLGLATLLPQLIDSARYHRDGQAAPTVAMNARYPTPARASETLSATQTPLAQVERRPGRVLSPQEFHGHYLARGIPLVITDALDDWPLFRMTRDEALQRFADLNGITRHGDYVSQTFSTQRDFRSMPMSEFIAQLEQHEAHAGEPAVYMGNNILPTALLDAIRLPPWFDAGLYNAPRLWIGPRGTLTPLHRDDSDNLFAQVWGEKSFILAAPHHRAALGTWSTAPRGGLDGCDFNPDAPDYQRFPQARAVPFLRLTLGAGDLLFLPEGWFHQVSSLSTSLSVNFWINSGRGW